MALYLTRFSYGSETWARLAQNPEDRRDAARTYIEAVGGKLHGFWYAFGEYDGYSLWEAPGNVAMAAVAVAISGGGALSKFENYCLADGRGDDGRDAALARDPVPPSGGMTARAWSRGRPFGSPSMGLGSTLINIFDTL